MRLEGMEGLQRDGDTDVSDLTTSVRTGLAYWDGDVLVLPFDTDPPPVEQVLIRRRLMTRDATQEQLIGLVADRRAALAAATDMAEQVAILSEFVDLFAAEVLRGIDAP